MGERRRKLYKYISLVAADTMDNLGLKERVLERFPHVSDRKIMKASLLAFSDKTLTDQTTFAKICDFAISARSMKPAAQPVAEIADIAVSPPAQAPAELTDVAADVAPENPEIVKLPKPRLRKAKILLNGLSPS